MSQHDSIPVIGADEFPVTESVIIHGPPGTGKTTQCRRRVEQLLSDHDYSVADVTWMTYRKDLALDTLTRLAEHELVADEELENPTHGVTRTWGTLHGVVRRLQVDSLTSSQLDDAYGSHQPNVAGHYHRRQFLDNLGLEYQPGGALRSPGELLLGLWDWCRSHLLDPEEISNCRKAPQFSRLRDEWGGSPVDAYRDWRAFLSSAGLMDYLDMIEGVLPVGHSATGADTTLTPSTPVLVCDETHDLTPVMAKLLLWWADDADIVIVAGDPDQLINQHEGPSRRLYTHLEDELGYPEVPLRESHRVPEAHWRAAKLMLREAHQPPDVEPKDGGIIQLLESPTFDPTWNGRTWIDGRVPEPSERHGPVWFVDHHTSFGSSAERREADSLLFLTRTRMQSLGVQHALDVGGVPYKSQSSIDDWTDDGRIHLYNVVTQLSKVSPGNNATYAAEYQLGDFEGGKPPESVELTPDEVAVLYQCLPLEYVTCEQADLPTSADEMVGMTVTLDKLKLTDSFYAELCGRKRTAILHQLDTNFSYEIKEKSLIQGFKRFGNRRLQHEDINRVQSMTIHAAKGHEADTVIVYDGVTNRVAEAVANDPTQRDNEARVWYVALSRASDTLYILKDAWEMGTVQRIPRDLCTRITQQVADGGNP
jgi:DNA helicase-2/ATP-dependent DNA helicase PcrA